MEITGTQVIAAPRMVVWNALNDPDILKRCLPGCESVERTSPEEFRIIIKAAIGPLRARFNGLLRMTEAQPPTSCVMLFDGQGGAIGFGKGSTSVTLHETAAGTELAYTAQAQVGGKLAQVGSRLIDSVAKKMAGDFFTAFHKQLAPPEQAGDMPSGDALVGEPPASIAAADASAAAQPSCNRAPTRGNEAGTTTTLVPGWWLAVAAVLGAAVAIASAMLIH
jgi:carbon monoxide dehydrogenase subunit G